MNEERFDGLARALTGSSRRRDLLAVVGVIAAGFGGGRVARDAFAEGTDGTPAALADPAVTPDAAASSETATPETPAETPSPGTGETATPGAPDATATPTPPPSPTPLPLPRLTIEPATVTVGTTVRVEAALASAATRARLRWDGASLQSGLATTPQGDAHVLVTTFVVSKSVAGDHLLRLETGNTRLEAVVTVVPALTVATSQPQPGSRLRTSVTGMPANAKVEIALVGDATSAKLATLTTDATGSATATLTVPTTPPPGAQRLVASVVGGGGTAAVALDIPCGAGQIRCGGVCRDGVRDRENCGACGTVCAGACVKGVCLAGDDREIDAFVARWKGKGIDFDGVYGYQCMDLYQQYNKEVWGEPQVPAGYAQWVWTKDLYPKQRYVKIARVDGAIPRKGDVVLWKSGNGAGHVAICVSATSSGFTSLDQNWPVGGLPQLIKHDYKDVLGWLRPV